MFRHGFGISSYTTTYFQIISIISLRKTAVIAQSWWIKVSIEKWIIQPPSFQEGPLQCRTDKRNRETLFHLLLCSWGTMNTRKTRGLTWVPDTDLGALDHLSELFMFRASWIQQDTGILHSGWITTFSIRSPIPCPSSNTTHLPTALKVTHLREIKMIYV